jgi:leucine dehydrogenase
MNVFDSPDFDAHETVTFFERKDVGLRAIIAIHSTRLGPSCGGTRMYAYPTNDAALSDALKLSRAMSFKSAIADLPLGGGKAVILADPAKDKSEALFLAYGEMIESLGGCYVTAMDVGVAPADMPLIARRTKYIAGYDQPGKSGGDSGPLTALGVFVGLKEAVKQRLHVDSTRGLKVAIQGLGKVGMGLAERLAEEGAKLIVADVNQERAHRAVDNLGATALSPDDIVTAECDVFSPNALGGILDDWSIPRLRCKVIAGGANNQLVRPEHGAMLKGQGLLYAPDYVINGGGIIRVAGQVYGWSDAEIERRVLNIAPTLSAIFHRANAEGKSTSTIADQMAKERIALGPNAAARAAE